MIRLSFTAQKLQTAAKRGIRIAGVILWLWDLVRGMRAAELLMSIMRGIRQKYIQQAFPYLMRTAFPPACPSQNADQYLLELQSKLALKQAQKTSSQPAQEIDYDSLFAQEQEPAEFNQLFSNSLSQHHNFSEIDEHYEEDSLFNDRDAEYFNPPQQQQQSKSSLPTQHHSYSSKDSSKILEILKMKDARSKEATEKSTNCSLRDSTSQAKNSSKSLVIKPKVPRKGDSVSISSHCIKIAGRQEATGKRVRTESNENVHTLNERFNQMCKTEYDNKEESAKNPYSMILEEKDSLECTFKPTLLKECLQEIKTKPAGRASCALKDQRDCKNSKLTSISHSLKLKNTEQERKSLETHKEKPVLSKKSSAQASGSTLDVATRNQLWLVQKQQRLNIRRKEEEQQKFKKEDFSFKPNINLYKNARPAKAEKEAVPPFFERLSMAKRKSTGLKFRREGEEARRVEGEGREKNKENLVGLVNEGSFARGKKQSYEEAVKELHSKIMKMHL